MKTLLVAALLLFSFKSFSAEVGEDQKTPCPYANQSVKRETKEVVKSDEQEKEKEVKTVTK